MTSSIPAHMCAIVGLAAGQEGACWTNASCWHLDVSIQGPLLLSGGTRWADRQSGSPDGTKQAMAPLRSTQRISGLGHRRRLPSTRLQPNLGRLKLGFGLTDNVRWTIEIPSFGAKTWAGIDCPSQNRVFGVDVTQGMTKSAGVVFRRGWCGEGSDSAASKERC